MVTLETSDLTLCHPEKRQVKLSQKEKWDQKHKKEKEEAAYDKSTH